MKKRLLKIIQSVLLASLSFSCSQYNVFKDVALGSDMESVENILSKNKIKYKSYPAAPLFDIDLDNPQEIADAITNKNAGMLGDMLYKDSLYYLQNVAGLTLQSQIFFFRDKCTNIELNWHIKSNPSMRKGYLASEKLREYISQLYPAHKFELFEDNDRLFNEKYMLKLSETVTITVKGDEEKAQCIIEDSELQKPFIKLKEQVNEYAHYY